MVEERPCGYQIERHVQTIHISQHIAPVRDQVDCHNTATSSDRKSTTKKKKQQQKNLFVKPNRCR